MYLWETDLCIPCEREANLVSLARCSARARLSFITGKYFIFLKVSTDVILFLYAKGPCSTGTHSEGS